MRWCVSVGAVLVAGAIVGGDVAGLAAPSPKSRFADTRHNVPSVNVELVIAVDVSYSMDMDELAIQREGYAQAIVSKDFLQALRAGPGTGGRNLFRVVDVGRREDHHSLASDRRPGIGGCRGRRDHENAGSPRFEYLDFRRDQFRTAAVRRESLSRVAARHRYFRRWAEQRRSPRNRRARRCPGEGHHHQRPADHGEGAILFDDRYRESRSLLRGLRDRRAGRLHHNDQGSRKIPGSDPDQACSRSCGPHAGAPDRPSRRERAPGVLSDRRKKMAGAREAMSVETIIQSRRMSKP